MKIIIASDIHGSATYCRRLLDVFEYEKAERLVLLGDILYHGPRNDLPDGYNPKAVADMLNAMSGKILTVRGNCDSEVDAMVLSFPIMSEYAVLFERGRMIYLTHGHRANELSIPRSEPKSILLHGHTHVPVIEERDDYVYINPGSVSIPKNGSQRSYITLDHGIIKIKTLDDAAPYMECRL